MGTSNLASFPIGSTIPSTDGAYAEYQKQLGMEVEDWSGAAFRRFRLVQANTADLLTGRKKVYTWQTQATYKVDIAGDGDPPCGVQLSTQESISDECLFWLQIAGRATCVDDGGTLAANDVLIAAATGDVNMTDAVTAILEDVVGVALAAAGANADVSVQLRGGL